MKRLETYRVWPRLLGTAALAASGYVLVDTPTWLLLLAVGVVVIWWPFEHTLWGD